VAANLAGSLAFGISAVYALILPATADALGTWAANLWTCLGAVCFFVGAFLLLPEVGRNVRVVDRHSTGPPAKA
jgi:hypothetical protein